MGAWVPQTLAVSLPRLMVHGATVEREARLAPHVARTSRRPSLDRTHGTHGSDSDAVACESIGGTLGSPGMSAVH
eukprot:3503447-Prymnesium_polylepis.1